jgi:hypothetical protein
MILSHKSELRCHSDLLEHAFNDEGPVRANGRTGKPFLTNR